MQILTGWIMTHDAPLEGGQIARTTFWAARYNCEAEAAFSHLSKTGIHMLDTVRFDPRKTHIPEKDEVPAILSWQGPDRAVIDAVLQSEGSEGVTMDPFCFFLESVLLFS